MSGPAAVQAQLPKPAAARPEAVEALGLGYRYLAPPPAAEPPPLALLLHGMGGDERVMWVFSAQLPAHWLQVAPRAPLPAQPAGWAWLPRRPDEWPSLARFDDAAAQLEGFLRGLPSWHRVDLSRTVLLGFSQGAATAFALALRLAARERAVGLASGAADGMPAWPSGPAPRLRGLASLVGFMPEGAVGSPGSAAAVAAIGRPEVGGGTSGPLSGLPVFLALGERDPLVPAARARQAADVARALGATVSLQAYEAGHKLPLQGLKDLGAWCRSLEI